jgi:hypothetical protein
LQLTPQEPPEHFTCTHELIPLQPIVVEVELLVTSAHVRSPVQPIAQVSPLHVMGRVQESSSLHWMSQAPALQSIGPVHVPAAMHPTLQSLPLQEMRPVHAPAPMQWMLHWLAALQSTVAVHEPAPVHMTTQGIPGGQTTGVVHVPAAVHVTVHVPAGSHVPTPASSQIEGQTAAASSRGAVSRTSPASLASGVLESRWVSCMESAESSASPPPSTLMSPG